MSELAKRVLVAAVGIPLALVIIYFGSIPFFLVLLSLSILALFEFADLAQKKGIKLHKYSALLFGFLIQVQFLLQFGDFLNSVPFMIAIVIFLVFVLATFIVELLNPSEKPLESISVTITSVAYIILFFASAYILREFDGFLHLFNSNVKIYGKAESMELLAIFSQIPNHKWAYFIFVMFGSIWICDSAAYFVGKSFGKHKLYEQISPKKTVEGALGGLAFAIISFAALSYWLIPEIPWYHTIVLGLIVGTIGQIGDLAESMLKRDAGVKDSSNLLPGHGGILDRFDSFLFVAPSIFVYFCIILYFNVIL